jgi:hypothetical protein
VSWFRSPAGVLAHADGPSQEKAFRGRGYSEVDEGEARKEVGDGIRLTVDGSTGSFDADEVRRAVAEEGQVEARARRSEASRKGAETKRRKAAAQANAEGESGRENGDSGQG